MSSSSLKAAFLPAQPISTAEGHGPTLPRSKANPRPVCPSASSPPRRLSLARAPSDWAAGYGGPFISIRASVARIRSTSKQQPSVPWHTLPPPGSPTAPPCCLAVPQHRRLLYCISPECPSLLALAWTSAQQLYPPPPSPPDFVCEQQPASYCADNGPLGLPEQAERRIANERGSLGRLAEPHRPHPDRLLSLSHGKRSRARRV